MQYFTISTALKAPKSYNESYSAVVQYSINKQGLGIADKTENVPIFNAAVLKASLNLKVPLSQSVMHVATCYCATLLYHILFH